MKTINKIIQQAENLNKFMISITPKPIKPISQDKIKKIKEFLKWTIRGRDYSMSNPAIISEDMAELILEYIEQLENNQKKKIK